MILGGIAMAHMKADWSKMSNEFYTRPDFKPFPAMIKEPTEYDPEVYAQMLEQNYAKYKNNQYKKSSVYRLLFPNHADFTPKTNYYV